jgi:heme-degrading monooxygenase HmoA
MPIKVLIKRRFKEGYFNEINNVIKEVRFGAMDHKGYISSETLWDHEDPFRVVVASNWRSIEHWNNWKNSELRKYMILEYIPTSTAGSQSVKTSGFK